MSHFDGFQPLNISTHALREEGDAGATVNISIYTISTHALREEGDLKTSIYARSRRKFLPTPSARRATAVWQTLILDP